MISLYTLILLFGSIPLILVSIATSVVVYLYVQIYLSLRGSEHEPTLWDYEFVSRAKEDEWFSLRWNAFWRLQEENKA